MTLNQIHGFISLGSHTSQNETNPASCHLRNYSMFFDPRYPGSSKGQCPGSSISPVMNGSCKINNLASLLWMEKKSEDELHHVLEVSREIYLQSITISIYWKAMFYYCICLCFEFLGSTPKWNTCTQILILQYCVPITVQRALKTVSHLISAIFYTTNTD